MIILLTTLHVIVCLFLIIVVLLQSGKAADLAGAFGGMGSQTAFGPRGSATVLSKSTTIAAGLFMLTSLSLSIMHTREGGGAVSGSVLEKSAPLPAAPAAKQAPAPVAPGGQPSVTLGTEGGKTVTMPLNIGKEGDAGKKPGTPATPAPAPPKK
jgi:preprotein translocase subunit SecG